MRVLLVDDDDAYASMMAEYLTSEGLFCERAQDAADGLQRALSGDFDVAVLDVKMPVMDGMELLRRLRLQSSMPVLMVTAKGDSVDRVVGLELGADDYVSKPVYPRELVARLRAVTRRTHTESVTASPNRELQVGPLRVAPQRRECWLGGQPFILTSTEFEIILHLARRPGEVLSKDELSELALHRRREPYDRSVDVHVSNLRQKLIAAGGSIEIETARGIGYRLRWPK